MTGIPPFLDLLPLIYRTADQKAGGQLAALTRAMDAACSALEADIAALYEDWFVETCDPRLLPELARLTGWNGPPEAAADPRTLVADRLQFTGERGSADAVERWLHALTGWAAHAETAGDMAKVRVRLSQRRLRSLHAVTPVLAPDGGEGAFRLHPLGLDARLWSSSSAWNDKAIDGAADVGVKRRGLDGRWRALAVTLGDLSIWQADGCSSGEAIIDPWLGRLLIVADTVAPRDLLIDCTIADAVPPRQPAPSPQPQDGEWIAYVHTDATTGEREGSLWFQTLEQALLASEQTGDDVCIRLLDSTTQELGHCVLSEKSNVCPADPNRPRRMIIEARPGESAALGGHIRAHAGGRGLDLVLRNLTLNGSLELLGAVKVHTHSVLIHPMTKMLAEGRTTTAISLAMTEHGRPELHLQSSATGPIRAGREMRLILCDSVVDGYGASAAIRGGRIEAERCTLIGEVAAHSLAAHDSLFAGAITTFDIAAVRLNHCALPSDTEAGVMQSCLPLPGQVDKVLHTLDIAATGYAVPGHFCPSEIRMGARNGGEIGVTNTLMTAQRERLARDAAEDILPLGISATFEFIL